MNFKFAKNDKYLLREDFSIVPIAFVSVDVYYFSSAVDILELLEHSAQNIFTSSCNIFRRLSGFKYKFLAW